MSGATNSAKRLAILLGFPTPSHPLDVVRAYRDRMKTHKPIPPRVVKDGPVLENIIRTNIDVLKFPAPLLHEHDGGRYIGTDDLVIMRDPEQGWVNCGTYRSMVQGPDRVGLWISPGKHGRQIREKYWREGKPCPVLISCGHDPLLFLAGGNEIRFGLSEYDYAAGHRGAPYDVIESELYRLPMPAHAEIVLEGAMHPGDTAPEGPFGEFTGYYAGGRSEQPVVRVERIYHRNEPILGLACPMVPPSDFSYSKCVMKAGMIWDEVERAGLAGVRGVWVHEAGCARMFNVISIKQAYAGHAKQAAMLAASCQSGSYLGRFVVVVDDDVDPANLERGDLGPVHALRSRRGHRLHPPALERPARPAAAEGRDLELARGDRCLPPVRDARRVPAGGEGFGRTARAGVAQVRRPAEVTIPARIPLTSSRALFPASNAGRWCCRTARSSAAMSPPGKHRRAASRTPCGRTGSSPLPPWRSGPSFRASS